MVRMPSLIRLGPAKLHQPLFDLFGQRRGRDIETQLHGRGDLVDVLAARARGADETLVDFAFIE